MKILSVCLAAMLALGLASPASAELSVTQSAKQPLTLTVQYRTATVAPAATVASERDFAVASSGIIALDLIKPGKRMIKYPSETALQKALVRMRKDPKVAYVTRAETVSAQFVPNDPQWPQLWNMKQIHLDVADDKETGAKPVLIVISDTASDCAVNPDLAPNCRPDLSRSFIAPGPEHWHGYHVAGIACGTINNGLYVAGVAGTCQFAFAQFLDQNGQGSTANGLLTVNYAIQLAQQGYKVVLNTSWGGGGYDQNYADAALALQNAGGAWVAAAGNSHVDICTTPFYPASYPGVIATAATDPNDALASFSNYGTCPTGAFVGAPGTNIVSLSNVNPFTQTASGTSMGSPHNAGAVALIWSQDPTITIQGVRDRLQNGAVLVPGLPVITGARLDLPNILVPPPPGVKMSLGCPVLTVNQKSTLNCSVSLLGFGGYTGSADLTCPVDNIPGATCVVMPPTITVGGTASVALTPSLSTPSPAPYSLVVNAVPPPGVNSASAQVPIKVFPFGTETLTYGSTQMVKVGKLCPGFLPACKPIAAAQTQITVPNNDKLLHLSGTVNVTWPLNGMTVSLVSPTGTVLPVPVPFAASGKPIAFDTDIFDKEPSTKGLWTMKVQVPPTTIFKGSLNGWSMSLTGVPQ